MDILPYLLLLYVGGRYFLTPLANFFVKNLLDSGKDRYSANNENNEIAQQKKNGTSKESIDELEKQLHELILRESGKEYFDNFKDEVEKAIELKQEKLTNNVISEAISDNNIENTITESIRNTIDKKAKELVRENAHFAILEKETLDRINLIKLSSFLEHLEKEYDATRSTKALMSNIFIIVNIIYFFGLLYFLVLGLSLVTSSTLYIALSFSYIGLGAFVVYMIKFCNARSLTLLSLREDFIKREKIIQMADKMIETGTNEHHVALLQIINSSVATKEQKISHPYEMLLYGIKDSNIMFKGGKFEIKKEAPAKQ